MGLRGVMNGLSYPVASHRLLMLSGLYLLGTRSSSSLSVRRAAVM